MRNAIAGIVVAAAVFGMVMLMRGGGGGISRPAENSSGANSLNTTAKTSSEAVLTIAPGARRAAPPAQRPSISPLMQVFAKKRDYKVLYDRAKASPKPTGEELYLMAEILERCAMVTDRRNTQTTRFKMGAKGSRERFVASLPPGAPDRDKRIAAFDSFNVDACAGLEGLETTEGDMRSLLARGAAMGDAKSEALLLVRDVNDSRRNEKGEIDWKKPVSISDAQIETFRHVVSSGDPRALVDVTEILSLDADFHLVASDKSPIEYSELYYAATLAACELGYPCGRDTVAVQASCAMQGNCDAADYRDYLLYYSLPPGSSQRVIEYQSQLLRLIRGGDWSYFTVERGPSPAYATFPRP